MIKRFVLLSGMLLFAVMPLISQQQRYVAKKQMWSIKTDIANLIYNHVYEKANGGTLTFEKSLCERTTLQITGKYVNYKNEAKYGLAVIPEFKCYMTKNYEGLYMGSYLKYENHSQQGFMISESGRGNYIQKATTLGAGMLCGYQVYMLDDLTIDVLLGFGAKRVSYKESFDEPKAYEPDEIIVKDRFKPDARFSLNIGYKF